MMADPTGSPPSPSRLAKSRVRLFSTIRRLLLRNLRASDININKPTSTTVAVASVAACVKINPLLDIMKRHELEEDEKLISRSADDDEVESRQKRAVVFGKGLEEKEMERFNAESRQKRAVKEIVFGKGWEEKERAAKEIGRLAREHPESRKSLAELGVIPRLVAMAADPCSIRRRGLAFRALLHLSNGSVTNSALMVEAGIMSTIPNEHTKLEEATNLDLALIIQSISSLAQLPLNPSSTLLPFLTSLLNSTSEAKHACLTSLYNLSTIIENTPLLLTNNNLLLDILLNLSSIKSHSKNCLATLGNLVLTSAAKKAMENHPLIPETLIDILTWDDEPNCQELSLYLLMILAHQSFNTREKMEASGIVPILLEVGLLGSALAQKRALRLLQWFKDERGNDRLRQCLTPLNNQGNRLINRMVKQSLYNNMEVITRRANLPLYNNMELITRRPNLPSRLDSLIVSSSSKSLPY